MNATRLSRLQMLLHSHEVDFMIVSRMTDIRWATGFTGSNGLLIVSADWHALFTDGRYRIQAQQEVGPLTLHVPEGDILEYIHENEMLKSGSTGILQADLVTIAEKKRWSSLFPEIAWLDATNLLTQLVAEKTPEELSNIERAQRITEDVFSSLLSQLKPGLTEKEVAAEIVCQHLKRGAERMSFDPIVATGPHSALPHARPTDRMIQEQDIILLDMGCFVNGYASDMTRTVFMGEPTPKMKKVYKTVRRAQEEAIGTAKAGITTRALDLSARTVIDEAGFGAFFTHSLGHGVGLEIHEWPRLSQHVEEDIPPGVVVSIEPGIYLPNEFGVRIEDLVVLTKDGCRNLTQAPKDLLVL